MLNGIRLYSSDPVWRKILSDLNAEVLDRPPTVDLNFDTLDIITPISALELKAVILNAIDNADIISKVCGKNVTLSRMQAAIITFLYKSGGMSAADLKVALGYAPDATTHAVDTAIYQLRRQYGRDFIQNKNGVYKIGRI